MRYSKWPNLLTKETNGINSHQMDIELQPTKIKYWQKTTLRVTYNERYSLYSSLVPSHPHHRTISQSVVMKLLIAFYELEDEM